MTRRELLQEIYYGNAKFKFLDEFYNTKEIVFRHALAMKLEGKSGSLTSRTEKALLGNTDIVDLRSKEEAFQEIAQHANRLIFYKEGTKVWIGFDYLLIADSIIIKGNRSNCTELRRVRLQDTNYAVKDEFRIYNNEAFSVAFRTPDKAVSIGVAPSTQGLKGLAQVNIKIHLTEEVLLIDDLSKYRDVSILLEGMSP